MWLLIVGLCYACAGVLSVHSPPIYPSDSSIFIRDGDTYDFIVVGAGAAGCAVAARLSEAGARVLLMEAGGDPDIRSRIPSLSIALLASNMDWNYKTIPNGKSCLASQDRQCGCNRGKVLGGSTAINYMMYVRGNRADYDSWNVTGWSWKDLEPYFLKFENLRALDELPASSAPYHNTSGPMNLEFFDDSENAWHDRILDGYQKLNFPYNYDVNSESQIGISQINGFVYDGERESTARGYLAPAVLRRNLVVAKHAHVVSVILDENKVAVGVRAVFGGFGKRLVEVFASKEVILSAGAIATPQILMMSGIGPAQHLKDVGVPVRFDNPAVGTGLVDHALPLVILKVDRGFGVNFPNLIPFLDDGAFVLQWIASQNGPYASNGLTDATAFVNSACYDFENHRMRDVISEECEHPTIQFLHLYIDRGIIPTVESIFAKAVGLNDDTVKQLKLANVNHAFIVMSPALLAPKSRGWVKLNSTKPLAPPSIFLNYLDHDDDVEELVRAIRIIEDLLKTKPFKENDASILELHFEACKGLKKGSDEYWRCYIRQMTHSIYHGVSTTALGRVVDEELRVYGVERLRVADGGVMKEIPRGNTAAACIVIGEKAAYHIQQTHIINKPESRVLLPLTI